MARTKTKTKRTLKIKGISFTTAKLKSVLSKVSKTTLVDCFLILFRAAPKKIQLRVAIKLERAPKKSTTRKSKTRKTKRRVSRKSSGKRKKTKAQIKAMRLRNLKKARAARKKKARR